MSPLFFFDFKPRNSRDWKFVSYFMKEVFRKHKDKRIKIKNKVWEVSNVSLWKVGK